MTCHLLIAIPNYPVTLRSESVQLHAPHFPTAGRQFARLVIKTTRSPSKRQAHNTPPRHSYIACVGRIRFRSSKGSRIHFLAGKTSFTSSFPSFYERTDAEPCEPRRRPDDRCFLHFLVGDGRCALFCSGSQSTGDRHGSRGTTGRRSFAVPRSNSFYGLTTTLLLLLDERLVEAVGRHQPQVDGGAQPP